jgi:hypothetical protein
MSQFPMRLAGASLFVILFAATPSTAALFTGPVDTSVAENPTNLVAGDLDGDGDPDLVVCHTSRSLVTILLNDGAGTFAPAPAGPLVGVAFPISAELGSFNADLDGRTDLVVVGYGSYSQNTAFVLLGDGAGGFHLSTSFGIGATGEIGRKVAVGDYDGDARDDLAFADGQVWLGRGDGTFSPGVTLPLSSYAFDVVTGDFDGDGRPDLAFLSFLGPGRLHVFLAEPGGAFTQAAGSPVALSGDLESLAAGDFDGDDNLDLAVTDIFGMRVFVLLNDGGGPTVPARFSPLPVRAGYPRGLAAADFDGDGRADLAVGSNNSPDLSILLANAGGLTEIGDSPLHLTGGVPISIVADDLDGDGDPDLAAVDFQGAGIAVFVNVFTPLLEVPIDILPDSDDNVINLESPGALPVAILSTEGFDATHVDPATVLLAGAPVRRNPSGDLACRVEALDADARVDLLCKVDKEAMHLGPGDTVATLEAVTFDGTRIRGQDTVRLLAH